jgi:hypothetical protein
MAVLLFAVRLCALSCPLSRISPTHKQNEGRAPEWQRGALRTSRTALVRCMYGPMCGAM